MSTRVGWGAIREGGVLGTIEQDDDLAISGVILLYRMDEWLSRAVLNWGLHDEGATSIGHEDLHYVLDEWLIKNKELLH
jgi:hypothetical protein